MGEEMTADIDKLERYVYEAAAAESTGAPDGMARKRMNDAMTPSMAVRLLAIIRSQDEALDRERAVSRQYQAMNRQLCRDHASASQKVIEECSENPIMQNIAESMDARIYFLDEREGNSGIYISADVEDGNRMAVIEIHSDFDGKFSMAAISLDRDDLEKAIHAALQLQTYLGWD